MSRFSWEKRGKVAVLMMNDGENRHDLEYSRQMLAVLDEIVADKEVCSLVLSSSDEKNFCQGVNLMWLLERQKEGDLQAIKDFMYGMGEVFKRFLLLPIPSVAAVNGHAFGNGAILACACDFRLMLSGRGFFCFPEVDVGVPFMPSMIKFVSRIMPPQVFNELLLTGRRVVAEEMVDMGFAVKACADKQTLIEEAVAYAATFEKKRGIFSEMKKRMHRHIIEEMDNRDKEYIEKLFLLVTD